MLAMIFGDQYALWEIAKDYWPIFPAAFLMALLATPICRKIAIRLNIVDVPDNDVKTHAKPTAYLGGLGILAGVLAGLFIGFWILISPASDLSALQTPENSFSHQYPNWLMLACIGMGAAIACMVGLIDDIMDIKPWHKLLGLCLPAVMLCAVDIRPDLNHLLDHIHGFWPAIHLQLPDAAEKVLSWGLVVFFILGASNSLNLLDGLDGLCAGVTSIITIAYMLIALVLASWGHSPVGDPLRLIVCLALVGGVLGFLPMNRHPAKIFMGDAGSMLLGFIAGTLMLLFMEQFGRWSVASIVVFGLPLLDTVVALLRRFINRKPLFVSDRGHIYDQLMDRGWGLLKTVKTCYLLAALYALLGFVIALLRFRWAALAFVIITMVSLLIVWRRGFLQIPKKAKDD
jgi:UDP-GlcNAc:undecaprenyl-phosphate GlcNAc-1-phosphate transferase